MSGMPKAETLVQRLRGIYAVGKGDPPEFGFRQFANLPAIQREAADRITELEAENAALRNDNRKLALHTAEQATELGKLRDQLEVAEARIAELEAGNAVLRAERDGYSARLDAAIKLIADILSALPPNAIKAPDGTIYEFDPPPECAMKMLRAFKSGIDAAILEGK